MISFYCYHYYFFIQCNYFSKNYLLFQVYNNLLLPFIWFVGLLSFGPLPCLVFLLQLMNQTCPIIFDWSYFLHFLLFKLIHILFRHYNRLYIFFSVYLLIFTFLYFNFLSLNFVKHFSNSKRLFITVRNLFFLRIFEKNFICLFVFMV